MSDANVSSVALKRAQPIVHSDTFKGLRLWADDLMQITRAIEAATEGPVELAADDWLMDDLANDLEELSKSQDQVRSFTIRAHAGKVRLDLGPKIRKLEVDEPNLTQRGMIHEVRHVLDARRRYPVVTWCTWVVGLLLAVVAAGLVGLTMGQEAVNRLFWVPFAVYMIFGVLWTYTVGSFVQKIDCRPRIYTRTRSEAPTFWVRKRDDLWIEATVSVVSLIVGGVIGYWINIISSPS
jgi:hypothetical protein